MRQVGTDQPGEEGEQQEQQRRRDRECGDDHRTGPASLHRQREDHLRQPRARLPGLAGLAEREAVDRRHRAVGQNPAAGFDLPVAVGILQQAVAEQYLRDGRYFWNCGIFCWKAATIMNLLQQYEPELAAGLREIDAAAETPDYPQVLAQKFPLLKSISIDYAVLERAQNVCVLEAPFQWDDVGSWLSLPRLNGSDAQGNTTDGLFAGVDTQGCIVRTSDDHLVATLGLRNLIIVHTPDATLVADAAQSERIKQLLDLLTEQQLQQYL